jgi:hypothetical protein
MIGLSIIKHFHQEMSQHSWTVYPKKILRPLFAYGTAEEKIVYKPLHLVSGFQGSFSLEYGVHHIV